jgi:glycosyltransferase involved in cell wall biosynthesis
MTSQPLVSVVIPAYNAASYIQDTLESVRSQTFTDWELLVINDGCTDATAKIVEIYHRIDPRIQLVTQLNSGVSAARNLGAKLAQGELIAFLDADDQWLPEKLAIHVVHMKSDPQIGISFARVEFLTIDGIPTGKFTNCSLFNLKPENFLYTNPTVTTSNIVIRQNLFRQIDGFDQAINYSEDMELLFRSACLTEWKIEGIDRVLVRYRIHTTGLSSTLNRMEAGWLQFIHKARSISPKLVNQHFASAHAAYLQYLARQTLRLGLSHALGIEFINRAFQSDWRSMLQPRSLLISLVIYAKYFTANLGQKPGFQKF